MTISRIVAGTEAARKLQNGDMVLAIDDEIVTTFRELERATTPLTLNLGGEQVTIHYRQSALTAWAEDAQGNLLPGVLAYEQGWRDFNPGSETYRAATPSR
ncbi:MAG: hypothetical protein IH793_04135 [Acidobacteria bacterium]|nr:hypothetical protein [Acidobacteriota bacterium]